MYVVIKKENNSEKISFVGSPNSYLPIAPLQKQNQKIKNILWNREYSENETKWMHNFIDFMSVQAVYTFIFTLSIQWKFVFLWFLLKL